MLQAGLNKRNGTHPYPFGRSSFLFLPLRLSTQKGECSLPHAAVRPPSQLLKYAERGCVDAEHQADPFGLLPALIDSPLS